MSVETGNTKTNQTGESLNMVGDNSSVSNEEREEIKKINEINETLAKKVQMMANKLNDQLPKRVEIDDKVPIHMKSMQQFSDFFIELFESSALYAINLTDKFKRLNEKVKDLDAKHGRSAQEREKQVAAMDEKLRVSKEIYEQYVNENQKVQLFVDEMLGKNVEKEKEATKELEHTLQDTLAFYEERPKTMLIKREEISKAMKQEEVAMKKLNENLNELNRTKFRMEEEMKDLDSQLRMAKNSLNRKNASKEEREQRFRELQDHLESLHAQSKEFYLNASKLKSILVGMEKSKDELCEIGARCQKLESEEEKKYEQRRLLQMEVKDLKLKCQQCVNENRRIEELIYKNVHYIEQLKRRNREEEEKLAEFDASSSSLA